MASNFPSSLDSFTNPSSSDAMDSVSVPHATQHSDLNDAVEALQAKVGADSSAVTTSLDYKVAQLEAISHGKILQVVRATDSTARTTTSGTFVDASISVTITPQDSGSSIILIWSADIQNSPGGTNARSGFSITDSSNNAVSGGENMLVGEASGSNSNYVNITVIGYDTPATTSAVTYKGRFLQSSSTSVTIRNNGRTGQLYAIEVSA